MLYWKRRYGADAWNPAGERPDFTKCSVEVEKYGKGKFTYRQCMNSNGHGPDGAFCKCHAPKIDD